MFGEEHCYVIDAKAYGNCGRYLNVSATLFGIVKKALQVVNNTRTLKTSNDYQIFRCLVVVTVAGVITLEKNWVELTFAKTSGAVARDRKKKNSQ